MDNEQREGGVVRRFDSGATRDDNANKLDYVRGLSSQVQQRYLEYMGAHRRQKDGSLRGWDNWKQGMPAEAYRESLLRHAHDAVRASVDLPVPEDATLEDLLCAVMFNASGWLFELLVAKSGSREYDAERPAIHTCGECEHYADTPDEGCAYTCQVCGPPPDASADPECFEPRRP